ncbi:DUF6087 family protein [Streptomyces qinglanensis]|uniref:DUF6087 family protein n=1 Tax=Streptomyces qinglanensis TaxID=943816 RepID=UPI003B8492E6
MLRSRAWQPPTRTTEPAVPRRAAGERRRPARAVRETRRRPARAVRETASAADGRLPAPSTRARRRRTLRPDEPRVLEGWSGFAYEVVGTADNLAAAQGWVNELHVGDDPAA